METVSKEVGKDIAGGAVVTESCVTRRQRRASCAGKISR
jgi:hypothetical protein